MPNQPNPKDQTSGSPMPGEPEFLAIGKLLRTHGLHGGLHLAIWTDFPERLQPGLRVYLGPNQQPAHVQSLRGHESDSIITFKEYRSPEEAATLRNQVVFVRTADLPPLPEGEIYLHQLIGLQVVQDEDDAPLGIVTEILETGANDVLIVRPEKGPDWLLPDIDSVILKIDLEKSQIRVHLIPGLLPQG